jgi:hypothetical protein
MPVFNRTPGSSIKTEAAIANSLFIGGGVVGIGAVALIFTTRWKSTDATTGFVMSPWMGPTGGGLEAHASF